MGPIVGEAVLKSVRSRGPPVLRVKEPDAVLLGQRRAVQPQQVPAAPAGAAPLHAKTPMPP